MTSACGQLSSEPMPGVAFFQGQAEIFELKLVRVAPDNENLSPRQNAIDPDKFRQYLHLNNSRHRPAFSLENSSLHDLRDHNLFPTPSASPWGAVPKAFLHTSVSVKTPTNRN